MLKLQTLPSPSTTSQQPFIGSVEFGVSSETHDRRLWQSEAVLQPFKHDKHSEKMNICMLKYILLGLIILYLNTFNVMLSQTQRNLQYYQHLLYKTSRYPITGDLSLLICIVGYCTHKNTVICTK